MTEVVDVPSLPDDEDIILQENNIKADIAGIKSLGEREPVCKLAEEYENGSLVFQSKIVQISKDFSSIRRARGDGNCFFRGFLFCFLEDLLNRADEEQSGARALVSGWKEKLVKSGFQELVFEDALEVLLELMQEVSKPDPCTLDELYFRLSDEHVSNYCIMLLRMMTSAEIQSRAEFFAPFIMGMSDEDTTVERFCQRNVEPMGEESEHVQIVAITEALKTPLRIIYLDNTINGDGVAEVNHHDFICELAPRFAMLYRPGHYDILYPA
mmetsp:Transcript_39513/g.54861  ORF Transcript_39513/g.54861 Transcript_39513/m.54861 type:complete len:269 (-) Transcript_39513:112-918(-)|eukprot:CAMPEP_0196593200 /NCGR_PEP_ID=MMETSP1081-20130531/74996_1 /TAXON_ID=36882 /ORGANISM="Pyramimonas amylifera, Strain CCMP720" /LENGTH=268 /DNA_ID=CAMNT_0041917109 /DNA_START=88 /DNA_END=894 /DNA_ORIENTATION=-